MTHPLGIYIHIPFCLQKCLYCDFCSFPGREKAEITRYAQKAVEQLRLWSGKCKNYTVDTVYFGGGTPTLMSVNDYNIIMTALREGFNLSPDAEITTECNPATTDREILNKLRELGINRLSIGAQSLDDDELKKLGRLHTADDFIKIFRVARVAGFRNISADLIYGIPGQNQESFRKTLVKLCDLNPEHVSAYCLKVEESTPFGRMGKDLVLPGEDETADMYSEAIKTLSARGLEQYEISNFAQPGYESRHNLKYWNCDEYLGIGVAAHSYFGGERFACHRDIGRYLAGDFTDESTRIKISAADSETEYVMLSMRLSRGLDAAEYSRRFGKDPFIKYESRFEKFIKGGYVISDADGYRFTPRGMFVSNFILSSVLDL
jgi:oxygen-independent coproporphyrinogen-3 oxidase